MGKRRYRGFRNTLESCIVALFVLLSQRGVMKSLIIFSLIVVVPTLLVQCYGR